MSGIPCIRNTRIPVSIILKLLAKKATYEEIMDDYSEINEEDIISCLEFAAWSVSEKTMRIAS
jgi:uncharacterized protein (DUF433 family)